VFVSLNGSTMPVEDDVLNGKKVAITPPAGFPDASVMDVTVTVTPPVNEPIDETVITSDWVGLPPAAVIDALAGVTVNPPVWTVAWMVAVDEFPLASVPTRLTR